MHRLTFYPLGNADTNFIDLEKERIMVLDYADMRNPNDKNDVRWDIKTDIAGKLKAKGRLEAGGHFVVRLPKNFTARLNFLPAYKGRGRHLELGEVVRPLSRERAGKSTLATPAHATAR